MYYQITDTLVELAEGKYGIESSTRAKDVLTFLNITIKLGKHFVYGRISLLERVLAVDSTLTSFNSIISSYSELGSIAKNFEWHAEFVEGSKQSQKEESTHTIFISLSDCAKFEVYKETLLLCEHINDAFFYSFITEYYKKHIGLDNITTSGSFLLGGGCSTAKVYEYEIDKKSSFIVCVTDSDYMFSNSNGTAKLGETAKSVESIERHKGSFFSIFYHLENVSEVENLIPFDLIIKYFSIPGNNSDGIDEIKKIASKDRRLLSFFDYKKGVSLRRLAEVQKDDNILDIVKLVVPNIEALIIKNKNEIEQELSDKGFPSGSKLYNEYKKTLFKERKYIHGLGDSIFDNILTIINKNDFSISSFPENLFDFFNKAEEDQKKEYEIIGRLLLNWTCALPQVLC